MSIFLTVRLRTFFYALIAIALLWACLVVAMWSWRKDGQPYTSGVVIHTMSQHIVITRTNGDTEQILFEPGTVIHRGRAHSTDDIRIGEHIIAGGRYGPDGQFHAQVIRVITSESAQ